MAQNPTEYYVLGDELMYVTLDCHAISDVQYDTENDHPEHSLNLLYICMSGKLGGYFCLKDLITLKDYKSIYVGQFLFSYICIYDLHLKHIVYSAFICFALYCVY